MLGTINGSAVITGRSRDKKNQRKSKKINEKKSRKASKISKKKESAAKGTKSNITQRNSKMKINPLSFHMSSYPKAI